MEKSTFKHRCCMCGQLDNCPNPNLCICQFTIGPLINEKTLKRTGKMGIVYCCRGCSNLLSHIRMLCNEWSNRHFGACGFMPNEKETETWYNMAYSKLLPGYFEYEKKKPEINIYRNNFYNYCSKNHWNKHKKLYYSGGISYDKVGHPNKIINTNISTLNESKNYQKGYSSDGDL